MGIHDLPNKWRERAHGDAAILPCADELEAHLKNAAFCHISADAKIYLEVIVPDAIFKATITKPTSCALFTKSGDTRRAVLAFD